MVFFDPDNGFETKTKHGTKWIRHEELRSFLASPPKTSIMVVYQHRPRRRWEDVFLDLERNIDYAEFAAAAYEPNLAFVALAGKCAAERVISAVNSYAARHPTVKYQRLRVNQTNVPPASLITSAALSMFTSHPSSAAPTRNRGRCCPLREPPQRRTPLAPPDISPPAP